MIALRISLLIALLCVCYNYVKAENRDLQTCEAHLNKYRRFLLQAILNFEDVCDAYNSRPAPMVASDSGLPPQIAFFGHYQPPEQKVEIWTFFKLLMAQFNEADFANIVRDAVIERCRQKFQQQILQQRDEKRNEKVIGKKQRFHSWGGKRSGLPSNDLETDHSEDMVSSY